MNQVSEHIRSYSSVMVGAVSAVFFLAVSWFRMIDGDEGFYLVSASQVALGCIPYLDFFFPQMPLLPYVYGAWIKVAGYSWHASRLLSVLFAALLAVLVYRHALRETQRHWLALLAVYLYCVSSFSLGWLTTVKTYALSSFLLFCAYTLFERDPADRRAWHFIATGLLLGLAIDTRLLYAATIPAFLIEILWTKISLRQMIRDVALLFLGVAAALAPNLVLFFHAPDVFIFNNLGFHAIRSDQGLIGNMAQKWLVLGSILGIYAQQGGMGVQFLILSILNAPLPVWKRSGQSSSCLSLSIAVLLCLVSILPTPSWPQYFATAIPFLVVGAISVLSRLSPMIGTSQLREARNIVLAIGVSAVAVYTACSAIDTYRFTVSGQKVPDIFTEKQAANWKIGTVKAIAKEIENCIGKDELVLTWWPGYVVGTHARLVPGTQNHIGVERCHMLSMTEAERYRIASREDIRESIVRRTPKMVVVGNWLFEGEKDPIRTLLRTHGYRMTKRIGDAEIYQIGPCGE